MKQSENSKVIKRDVSCDITFSTRTYSNGFIGYYYWATFYALDYERQEKIEIATFPLCCPLTEKQKRSFINLLNMCRDKMTCSGNLDDFLGGDK